MYIKTMAKRIGSLAWCLGLFISLVPGLNLAADSSPSRCERSNFVLAIDIGHDLQDLGALSARGVGEYYFNRSLAKRLLQTAKQAGFDQAFLIGNGNQALPLERRAAVAASGKADLLLSVHHDSMRPWELKTWQYQGRQLHYGDQFNGHSIFYSKRNPQADASLFFAQLLGRALLDAGLSPTLHHRDVGSRKLVDKTLGLYRFDNLIILHKSKQPAVLFEAGIILNRNEEMRLRDPRHQQKLVQAILAAVDQFCATQDRG